MKPPLVIGGAIAVLAGAVVVGWAIEWGPFSTSLDEHDRAIVDAVETGEHAADQAAAVSFVADNLDALLTADVARSVDGDDLADLFATALRGQSTEGDLLGRVVVAVAEQGEIHDEALPPVLAELTADNMGWFDERINAPAYQSSSEDPPSVQGNHLAVHDFLREVSRYSDAAEILYQALYDYGLTQVAAAADSGDERDRRLRDLGRIQAFFLMAQRNAERGQAIDDDAALAAAEDADEERGEVALADRAVWLAVDLYASDPTVRELAEGQGFVAADGALKSDLSADETEALRQWARRSIVGDEGSPGPAFDDAGMFRAGAADITNGGYGTSIEDRY